MEPIYAIGLTRVSSQKQGKFWDSPEVQEQAIKRTVEWKGEILLMTFKENYTGTKLDRPAIKQAIEFIKASKVKISKCYFYSIDRSSRWWHDVHHWIKEMFKNVGVSYLDIAWVIQEKTKAIHIEWVNTDGYSWAYDNPSKYTEEILVMMAEGEKDKMLQRTISQEIRNTQSGYHQRESHFWLKNIKIQNAEGKKKVIEVPDEIEGKWMKQIYELRAIGIPDSEIVTEMNLIGFRTRIKRRLNEQKGWIPLTIKYLQSLIKNPVYAGVKMEKWTGYKPIRVANIEWYHNLVDISTWNRANKWKVQIIEGTDWEVDIIYSKKWKESFEPIIERRKTYDSDYPFSQVLRCPVCAGHLTPNKSKSGAWTHHYYYQCNGKKNENWIEKHLNYSLKRNEVNTQVITLLNEIKPLNGVIKAIDYISSLYFDSKNKSNKHLSIENDKRLKEFEDQKKKVEESLHLYIHLPKTMEAIEKQLQKIDEDIFSTKAEFMNFSYIQNIDKSEFRKFMNYCISHMGELASDSENPEKIELIFRFIFQEKPTYEEIKSHTPNIYPV
ncbi:MAG: NUDIX hydrolase, partial [uncultured bacterium (gcode 4)]